MNDRKLLPCRKCGSAEINWQLQGTQPDVSCEVCGETDTIQLSDYFTKEERFMDPDFKWRDDPFYDYGEKGTQRAREILTKEWNTRTTDDKLSPNEYERKLEDLSVERDYLLSRVKELEAQIPQWLRIEEIPLQQYHGYAVSKTVLLATYYPETNTINIKSGRVWEENNKRTLPDNRHDTYERVTHFQDLPKPPVTEDV